MSSAYEAWPLIGLAFVAGFAWGVWLALLLINRAKRVRQ